MLALVSGCSWFSGDDEDEEVRVPEELLDFSPEVTLARLWEKNIGKGADDKAIRLVPALVGSRIFAASADGTVQAMNAANGRVIWKVKIQSFYSNSERKIAFSDDAITGGVGAGQDLVLVGSAAGEIVAMNQSDGSLAWRAKTSSEVLAPPQVSGQLVVAQTIDGKVAGFNALDGERSWLYSTSIPSLTLRGTSTPIVAEVVIAAFANGRVSVLDRENGMPVMDSRVAAATGKSDLERLVDVDGAMVTDGNTLYAASYQGNLVAFELASRGRPRWSVEASSVAGLGAGFGNIYLAGEDSVVSAFEASSGKRNWEKTTLRYRDITTPVTISSYIAMGDFDGYLHLLAQSDGRVVARRRLDSSDLDSAAVVDGTRLYVLGNSGRLIALELQ